VAYSLQFYLMAFLKTMHHDPRPFWENEGIRAGTCYTQFGNPSGHAVFATFFCSYLFINFVIGYVQDLSDDQLQVQIRQYNNENEVS